MAKTRAQRKAERRRREQQAQRRHGDGGTAERTQAERDQEERAQEDTQRGVSGEVAEAEAVMQTGAQTEDYGERVEEPEAPPAEGASPVPGVIPPPVQPEAPAPSRADVGRPEEGVAEAPPRETGEDRRTRRQREKEERRKARAKELQKGQAEKAEKKRGPVIGFLVSCWAELKRVQWPDRDTLVQATAVTFIFIAILGAYLGALDAAFNWLVQRIL
jgi:preprotein translocase SecE subunit